jgi:hypothetical protein
MIPVLAGSDDFNARERGILDDHDHALRNGPNQPRLNFART